MTTHHDAYRDLAGHYDLHRCDWYAGAFGPRLFPLLAERGLAGGRVLDAGCGTGTLALAFDREGYTVSGIDLSEAMLATAREKDREGKIRWRKADITDFDLTEGGAAPPFDLITSVGDTVNHLQSLDEWEAAFRAFARHLRPGGALYLDVMTLRGLAALDHYAVTDLPDRAVILGFMFEPATGRSTMKLTSFTRRESDGAFERSSETITEWGHPVAAILDRLARAGFTEPERLWARSEDPEAEERLTVLARRA
jgi:SAM-dependent methyltransferase